METAQQQTQDSRRKHIRRKSTKRIAIAWKSPSHRTLSAAGTIGLGGVYLSTPIPQTVGTTIELVFQLPAGEVRARAIVRHSTPRKGMGLQFVEMRPEVRARIHQFLSEEEEVSSAPGDSRSAASSTTPPGAPPDVTSRSPGGSRGDSSGGSPAAETPNRSKARNASDTVSFQVELNQILELARRGTYYQLLNVTSETPAIQVKQSFYALARKFHPDHHMERTGALGSLKDLMGILTDAYRTLSEEEKRQGYDRQLATSGAFQLRKVQADSQETIEECIQRANQCVKAGNHAGSIGWLRKVVEMAPETAPYHAQLARSLAAVADYRNEAISQFYKAIQLDPWDIKTYFSLAELYETMQLRSNARSLYTKILEIDPTNAKAQEGLAKAVRTQRSPAA